MKKSYVLLLSLLFAAMIYPQLRDIPSAGPAPETKDQGPLVLNTDVTLLANHAFAHVVYGGTTGPSSFWLNNPGTITNLAASTKSIFAADFNGTGVWYALDYTANQLLTCDTSTGVFTVIGSAVGAGSWTGMSWDKTTNTMYVVSYGTASTLQTIDLATGAVTSIGVIGSYIVIDIAIDESGNMYGHEISTDNIISINKTTGAGTIIGLTGFNANYAQGMSFDPNDGTLYLAAYNGTTSAGELRTVNTTTGMTTLVGSFMGGAEVDGFAIPGGFGAPCPVGPPTNPTPADNAVNLPRTGVVLSWTNPANATNNQVWFGTSPGSMTMVHSGSLASSYAIPGTLNYFTNYYWKVVERNDTCGVNGPIWTFKTLQDPNLYFAVNDDFSAGTGNWTITNDGGTCVWLIFSTPYPNTYTLPATSVSPVLAADADECGTSTTLLSTATLTEAKNFTQYQTVKLEFDSDWNAIDAQDSALVDVSNDGGATWVRYLTYGSTDMRNEHLDLDISATAALHNNVKVRFVSIQPGYDWWWAIDNVKLIGSNIIPVELVSFKANANGNSVTLNWMTATETNNNGFEIERSFNGSEFAKVGFVNGNGTTTETKAYSFTDSKLGNGTYSYRLKQVDFDGTFEYSNAVEVEVNTPVEYTLDQNYPNPFNPSTKISFTLAADSKVSLKIFNLLGQEVAVLVNGTMNAGSYNYSVDFSNMNSGVYFYQIEAQGNDGSSFKSIKKMMLTK